MSFAKEITVRVLKYDLTEYRRWNARVSRREGPLLVFDAEFDVDVEHDLLGQIRAGTRTVEYYWLDRWYNVFQFLDEHGGTQLFYCNVNMPPTFEDWTLTYVDLDIDVLVQPDLTYTILDLDDFENNSQRFGYPEDLRAQAQKAVQDLVWLIKTATFPFR